MRSFVLTLGVLVPVADARAEEPPPPSEPIAIAAAAGERVTMPAKRGMIHALVGIDLSKETSFDPFSISPDIWYGVNDKLTVGLIHSFVGATGVMGIPGTSLCLAGDACEDIYNGVGLDARYTLKSGSLSVAANGGLYANEIDPLQLAVKLGAVMRYRPSPESKLALELTPNVFIGVTERDGVAMTAGNKEVLALPATVLYAVIPKLSVAAQAALLMPIEDAADFYFLAVSVGASYQLDHRISIDGAFTLPFVAGGDLVPLTGIDARTFTLGGGYAF